MIRKAWFGFCMLTLMATLPTFAESHPFNAEDLVTMKRLSDPQVSPDGKSVVYGLRETDLDANKGLTNLWMLALEGSEPRQLTTHKASDWNPRFAPDGKSIYFLSTRSGSSQVWRLPLHGGESEQMTDLPLSVGNLLVSPDGQHIAFSIDVFADCAEVAPEGSQRNTLDCTADRLDETASAPTSGRVYDGLFIRHWDTWKDGRRSHLFVHKIGSDDAPVDVTAGMDADVPSKPFGGPEEITFTPDGSGLVFSARDVGASEPWSTDFSLYHAPIDASAAPKKLTENPAWDTHPMFSPDGKTLAYHAMKRPGFEADRFAIMLRSWPDGEERELAPDWDRSAGGMLFSGDGKTLYVTAQDIGEVRLFAIDVASGKVSKVADGGHVRSPQIAGDWLIYGRDDLQSPVDLYARPIAGGDEKQLTQVNREHLAKVRTGEYEQFSFPGWNDETVYGYAVKPVDFEEGKTYPLAFLIHGGPQGSFDNDFHYRWNPQTYTGAGYGVVMIDFHGSTGYGQAFTDSITGDWGGKPLEDLKKGLAAALERYSWIDGDQVCALGASYGGYMINWIAGNWSDRFRCLVNHDGLFDLRSMYYSTEELWFPEWEIGKPWEKAEEMERHNPANFVEKWQTPMLVIHGALDFRVVESQGFQTFTALQRQGIPSQLLYYPDENHWVLQPHNSIQWHDTVLAWLDRWIDSDETTE